MSDEPEEPDDFDPNFLTHHYDREGNPIFNVWEWERLFSDADYKIVRRTELNRLFGQPLGISTAWLGIDHDFGFSGVPVIFETMVFGLKEELCYRYTTETEAKQGHEAVVRRMLWRSLFLARKTEEK